MAYKNKEEQSEYMKSWYAKNKERQRDTVRKRRQETSKWFVEYKRNLKCEECGENHPACLDFNHLDRDLKEGNIGAMIWQGYKKESILEEMSKCKVLCANCHRKVHWTKD